MLITIGILLILIVPLTLFYGHYSFYRSVEREVSTLFNTHGKKEKPVTLKDLNALPYQLTQYLMKVGVVDACKDCNASFKQTGSIKTGQHKNWTDFTAMQYMTARSPNFIWCARSFPMFIRDKSINGQGEVKVSLFGLKDVAKSDSVKIDESALARSLGELLFYPVGFLSKAIMWKVLPDGSLKAMVQVNGTVAQGIFFFNEEQLLYRYESKRYMGETLEDFTGIAEDYKQMGGLLIPSKMRAIWNLKEGDFEYFNCTITDYNID